MPNPRRATWNGSHGKNATLANGSGGSPVGFSFGTGRVDNALTLSSSDQAYVSLPRGLLSQLSEATIATWVKLKSGTAFQRIFDFGIRLRRPAAPAAVPAVPPTEPARRAVTSDKPAARMTHAEVANARRISA
ncbi:MAG: hypothetical protein ABI627_17880 [Polyangiaceae bacterium]